jgi:hypothetical protein
MPKPRKDTRNRTAIMLKAPVGWEERALTAFDKAREISRREGMMVSAFMIEAIELAIEDFEAEDEGV